MNKLFSFVAKIATGGVGTKVFDLIDRQFPGKLSAADKAELQKSLAVIDKEKAAEVNEAIQLASDSLNKRIADHEGTAAEIRNIFFIGPLIILARSMFRPICSYVTLYIDYVYFTSTATAFQDGADTLLILINAIVLGFWFGERTIKNLMPLILAWLDKRQVVTNG